MLETIHLSTILPANAERVYRAWKSCFKNWHPNSQTKLKRELPSGTAIYPKARGWSTRKVGKIFISN